MEQGEGVGDAWIEVAWLERSRRLTIETSPSSSSEAGAAGVGAALAYDAKATRMAEMMVEDRILVYMIQSCRYWWVIEPPI